MVMFKTSPELSKMEIKQILEKQYQLDIEKINTVNYHGKIKKSLNSNYRYKTQPFKKVFAILKSKVDEG
eukprot:CAMPEP_0116915470 /NCGR_PEP_ID=MMETSP0467-20121206/17946_1 /TAXON_ID=283647 /ORGANISM="Mesodinium pulex, Strain SPMC105" /LENGTH=68 /DNA_ID=CAMNT_0004592137 /DNA_START=180 /DNA_END=386 /DNA_ORIENTATION=-